MSMLEGFRDKEFLDQITILNQIAGSKDAIELSGLVDLLKTPVGDTSIDYMVVNALNAVLSDNEPLTVQGLEDNHEGYQLLCIRVAGEHQFASAAQPLNKLAATESNADRLMEIVNTLARIADPVSLPTFRRLLDHYDPFIKAACIEAAGKLRDRESVSYLIALVDDSQSEDLYETCDITTWKAVEALAAIGTEVTLTYLAKTLHHKNPTARRIITDSLVSVGKAVVPMLLTAFEEGTIDERILSANVLGFIADKSAADGLVAAFDKGLAADPNVRYAVYEALGRIGTMKGLICLMDGLEENEELTLLAVVTALDAHLNPGIVSKLAALLTKANDQSDMLAKAVIHARATAIFDALYEQGGAGDAIMDALVDSHDPEVIEEFRNLLTDIGGSRAEGDVSRLPTFEASQRLALAADDSRSMLAMHRAILTDMGFDPHLGTNGQEAMDLVEQGLDFEIIITDMNMPVMDGMELVGKLRQTPGYEDVPIIMVTTESEATQQDMAEKTGVSAFITKPFKPAELKDKIEELLG